MKKILFAALLTLLITSWSTASYASQKDEIDYLLRYGYKVLIEGKQPGDKKWSWACRLKRSFNYIAIVQNDGANYRIIPIPLGKRIEPICPKSLFKNAHQWLNGLHKSTY